METRIYFILQHGGKYRGSFANIRFDTEVEAREALANYTDKVKPDSEYFEYWKDVQSKIVVAKVIEITEELV